MEFSNAAWLIAGFLGQGIFAARFLVQWLYSEFKKRSSIPEVFWYLSVVGGAVLLTYAIHKRDPVFIIGQSGGLLVYLRNLQWRLRERRQARESQT